MSYLAGLSVGDVAEVVIGLVWAACAVAFGRIVPGMPRRRR